jgi:hypothetical protein
MGSFAEPRLERPAWTEAARRHPWLAASLIAHLLLAAGLAVMGPVRVAVKRDEGVRTQVDASLRQTARREMQRQLRSMEEIRQALERSAGGVPADGDKGAGDQGAGDKGADPETRARRLVGAIEALQQKTRAAEMARLLGIPEKEALKRVRAEAAKQPRPALPKGQPQAVVARLAAQAKAALAQRRAELMAQQQGVKLNQGRAAQGGPADPASQAGQGGPLGKNGGKGGNISGGPAGQSASLGGRLDALASGLGLGTPNALVGSSLDMSSEGFSDGRRYGEFLAPPLLDGASVRTGAGRRLGRGGSFANRVFLDTWYVIGPFAGRARDSISAVYPPERGVDLDAVYYGKNDEPVRWTWQQEASYPFVPRPRAENAVYYAYTEVEAERELDVWMSIGADDDSKLWFNDRLVWISGDGDKPWYRVPFYSLDSELALLNLTEGQRKLRLHKGRNTILLKLYNGTNLMFFSVVLTPAD